ncbi:Ras-related protein RabX1 [Trypanosoma equiperdum]|uniref:Small GTP-binding protein Rab1 n=6 Tax=Trypanozoon TaxID=39700 RepID=D6XLJ6_TRYB2|nr:small GTP-binding protein Rab1, putative [Trypanosoma brucei gambiense DAL972]XP_847292.1 small GTP-binding protein Rab1 [Trypanosoma brucei brucei TREU927]AAX70579.1 small GTP-binding protein Rab1 [Trypanosoma brucei]RHW71085.1 Ras-related protein RabX1 [Trypanosoma brucei equiperdum]CAA68211.1 rab1 [Trypanosoma brucei brucei]SCU69376.1 Ras-related protein RabX1 [Trypanosoma equiperdum]AAZ13226.1 small GTP-binding protein Rab1 [Trypanosoma brucei brucei TREU927]|eukprot:XP_011775776.1 small GTP-binding protein Rab1, putative [Trypanosoma brucei gambiense DAL972]
MITAASPGGDCDYIFKIIVIGDSGVGKSSLTVRLSEDVFYKDYASTIAIDFRMHQMTYMDKRVRLQIWDTAGQERFQSVATAFYRGANGVMLCFDLTHRPSFLHLEHWMERVRQQSLPGIPCLLVGCKSDEARTSRQVSKEEAMAWAKQHGMSYIDTSAKEKENVQSAFQKIAQEIFEDMKERTGKGLSPSGGAGGAGNGVRLAGNEGQKGSKRGGCC